MIRRHDRYILKSFWATLAAVAIFFTVISVVLDMADRTSRVMRNWSEIEQRSGEPPWLIMVKFYATLVPFILLRILPFCVPMAAMFSLTRLARGREITPLLTTGVSLKRVVLPVLLSGCVVAAGMLATRAWLVPQLNRTHMKLARILSKSSPDRIKRVPHFHDPSGARVSCASFNVFEQRLEKVQVTFFGDDGTPLVLRWYPSLTWDAKKEIWTAQEGGQKIPFPESTADVGVLNREPIPPGARAPISAPSSLYEITLTRSRAAGLSFSESDELRRANPTNPRFVAMHHELWTVPISAIVLLLLALPFAVPLGVRNPIPGLLGSLGMAAVYFAGNYLFTKLGGSGDWHPILMAWLPAVVFGSLGLVLYLGMDG